MRGQENADVLSPVFPPPSTLLPLRVCYVIWSLELGGAEQVLMRLASGMRRRGHAVSIVTLNAAGVYAPHMTGQGVDVIPLHKRGTYDITVVWRMARVLKRLRPDVVHTHLWGASVWGRLAAWLAGVQIIIAHEHGMQPWRGRFHFACDRWLAKVTYRILFASEQVLRVYHERTGIGLSRCAVIPNGVNIHPVTQDRTTFRRARGWSAEERVFISVGRLSPEKGYADLLEAFAGVVTQLPHARLVLVGDGEERAALQDLQGRIGLNGQVTFAGRQDDVASWLAAGDVYVQPSRREGLPLAVLEAMVAGLPVVATAVGDVPRLITDGREGHLVAAGQPQALAAKLVAVGQNLGAQQPVVDAAKRLVASRYCDEGMVAAVEAVYAQGQRR